MSDKLVWNKPGEQPYYMYPCSWIDRAGLTHHSNTAGTACGRRVHPPIAYPVSDGFPGRFVTCLMCATRTYSR